MYDYEKALYEDIKNYIESEFDLDEYYSDDYFDSDACFEDLIETLWVEDSVTGNGTGMYEKDNNKAKEYVMTALSVIFEAIDEGIMSLEKVKEYFDNKDYISLDVCIRCYLLDRIIYNIVSEYEEMIP